jgi:TPR repeat protein/uncharacterized caspase-like protein
MRSGRATVPGWALLGAILLVLLPHAARGQATTTAPRGDKYALLVGVRQYENNQLRNLKYAEPDVVALAEVLRDRGYRAENLVLMTQTRATDNIRFLPLAANIRKELHLLLKSRSRADSVLVVLAGHGVQFRGSEENYFCPTDATLTDKNSLIPLREVYQELDKCPAGFKLLLVDACRNDPIADASRGRLEVDLESVTRPQQLLPPGGVAAFYSCSAGEKSYEDEKLQHGVFLNFVIKGLRGEADLDKDHKVTLPELEQYIKKQVPDYVRVQQGQDQLPDLVGKTHGLVPLVNLEKTRQAGIWADLRGLTPEQANRLHLEPQAGQAIVSVLPGGPAEKEGLRAGDVIIKMNGHEITWKNNVPRVLADRDAGDKVKVEYLRDGERREAQVVLIELPALADRAKWYRQLAEQGETWAEVKVGLAYYNGEGVPQDDAESAKWLRKAADKNDPAAQNSLGWLYQNGRGVPKEGAEAARWYRKAADQGYAQAQLNLGILYLRGTGVPQNDAEAAKWYRKAAEQGSSFAAFNVATLYHLGRGVARDDGEAAKWYRKAAEEGLANAQCELGLIYQTGRGLPKDEAESVKWYRKAADQDYPAAQGSLGWMYEWGHGVPVDLTEAINWYRDAAEQDNPFSQRQLGLLYREGKGVPKDDGEAVKWFRRSADLGFAQGQNSLGFMYENGRGVPKDEAEAVKWYRKAADQGDLNGQTNLGNMYRYGRSVPKDEAEAVKWYRKAADQGFSTAQVRLGEMYEAGKGVAKDAAEAVKWYRKAAEQKDEEARKKLQALGLNP